MKKEFDRAIKEVSKLANGRPYSVSIEKDSWYSTIVYHIYIAAPSYDENRYVHVDSFTSFNKAIELAKETLAEHGLLEKE